MCLFFVSGWVIGNIVIFYYEKLQKISEKGLYHKTYYFRNKLEFLSLNTRLGWKGLPETDTLAYYGNRKLRS
jgi:hypothetical protein